MAGLSVGLGAAAILYAQPAHAQSTATYTKCADEWNTCSFTGTHVVRYGDDGHYLYKTFTNGTPCRNDAFGSDPHPGVTKSCAIESGTTTATTTPTTTTTSTATTYQQCAKEWATCSFTGTRVVRYGDEGHYLFKTFTNGTPCRNDAFGSDPNVGALDKTCALESVDTSSTQPTTSAPTTPAPTPAPAPVPSNGVAQRPSYNLGTGFFVLNGKLYDANGNELRIRGVNKVHWDVMSLGLSNANANATRWTIDFNRRPSDNLALLQGSTGSAGTVAKRHVVIPGNWDATCKEDPSALTAIVDTWVAQAATWTQLEKYMILNIANEWGPGGDGTVWRDQYITAIKRLRAAGYHATLWITAGGCGQDPNSIVKWGQAVFNADPEKNVVFDQHIYGGYQDVAGGAPGTWGNQPDLETQVKALAATGLVVMLGEFGPGRDIGASPTNIKPERVMQMAETYGLSWLGWAWDDNNLANAMSDDNGFSMSYSGSYNSSSDLTIYGRVIVEHPTLGLKVLGKPASIFR